MKSLNAFASLIRFPNLVFIVITQWLFYYCVLENTYHTVSLSPVIHGRLLIVLILASVCIAAAGNIINDYFDLNIDQINKPERIVVDTFIKRRWVILWHLILSMIGIICSIYVAFKINQIWLAFANCLCVVLLFIYSASLKKKLLIGNIVVSLLTAWVILILALTTFDIHPNAPEEIRAASDKVLRLGFLYAGFAFIISIVREAIKDIEDIIGDRKYNCKTMPIVWGINAAKVYVAVWLVVLIAALAIAQIYVIRFGWWQSVLYGTGGIIFPLIWVLKKLYKAQSGKDFHLLSTAVKIIMLIGILSILFFKWYA